MGRIQAAMLAELGVSDDDDFVHLVNFIEAYRLHPAELMAIFGDVVEQVDSATTGAGLAVPHTPKVISHPLS